MSHRTRSQRRNQRNHYQRPNTPNEPRSFRSKNAPIWDHTIQLVDPDPHPYLKYKSEDHVRCDALSLWNNNSIIGSIGVYISDLTSDKRPSPQPSFDYLSTVIQAIVTAANNLQLDDDRIAFIAGHLNHYVCYGYHSYDTTYRTYWAEIKDIRFKNGVFYADFILRAVTYCSPIQPPVGQVRSIGEIVRTFTGKPYTYNVTPEATGISP